MDHTEFSRKGGSSKSERKRESSKANMAKARAAKLERIKAGSIDPSVKTAVVNSQEDQGQPTDSVGANASTNSA